MSKAALTADCVALEVDLCYSWVYLYHHVALLGYLLVPKINSVMNPLLERLAHNRVDNICNVLPW